MEQRLNYFAVIDMADAQTLFEHVWCWPEGMKRSNVPNLVANLTKYAQEIGGGVLRDADFELTNAQNVMDGCIGSAPSTHTKMICTRNESRVGALFHGLPELTGHDGRDATAKHVMAEYANRVLREAFESFLEAAHLQGADSNAAYERPDLNVSEDDGTASEERVRGGAHESKVTEMFRVRLQTIASQTDSSP